MYLRVILLILFFLVSCENRIILPKGFSSCDVSSDCNEKEWCGSGVCLCQPGFVMQPGACVENAQYNKDSDKSQLCDLYFDNFDETETSNVVRSTSPECDAGVLGWGHINDFIRRLNFYRSLVGLKPVYVENKDILTAQEAAMMFEVNQDLRYDPPESWKCYSEKGREMASHNSLLSLEALTPVSALT